jgi:hypothetical protein
MPHRRPQPPPATSDAAVRFANNVLEWGQVKDIITPQQRLALQREAARQWQAQQVLNGQQLPASP